MTFWSDSLIILRYELRNATSLIDFSFAEQTVLLKCGSESVVKLAIADNICVEDVLVISSVATSSHKLLSSSCGKNSQTARSTPSFVAHACRN